MANNNRITINHPGQMNDAAKQLLSNLDAGDIILLQGDLGAGKTTFVQALARQLNIKEKVTSPTFTIVGEYDLPKPVKNIDKLIHVDLYRLDKTTAQNDPAIQDILSRDNSRSLIAIEWAQRLDTKLNTKAVKLNFEHTDDKNKRIITISHPTNARQNT